MIRILRSEHPEYNELQKRTEVSHDFIGIEISSDEVKYLFENSRRNQTVPFSWYFSHYPQEAQWVKEHFPEAFI